MGDLLDQDSAGFHQDLLEIEDALMDSLASENRLDEEDPKEYTCVYCGLKRYHLPGAHDQCDHSPTGDCVDKEWQAKITENKSKVTKQLQGLAQSTLKKQQQRGWLKSDLVRGDEQPIVYDVAHKMLGYDGVTFNDITTVVYHDRWSGVT